MALEFSKPCSNLDAELKEVRADATAFCEALSKINAPLPESFPKKAVLDIAGGLRALPDGTARGCLRPLTEAQSQLATVRSEYIIHETTFDPQSNAPPLFRGEQIDQRLRHLMSSVSTALQTAYRLAAEEPEPETSDERIRAPHDAKIAGVITASESLEFRLDQARQELDEIRKPESERAENLSRQLVDVQILNSIGRGEIRSTRVATGRLKRIAATMREYPRLIKQSARLVKVGADVADYAHNKWIDLQERLFKAGTDTIREVADDVEHWAEGLEAQRNRPHSPVLGAEATPTAEDSVERGETPPAETSPLESVDLPPGWEIVDRDALMKIRASPPSLDAIVQFFDGILPTWRLALAPGVQPRAVAERLANRLRAVHAGAAKPEVVLLSAAGGEGKSTALLHAAAALVEDKQQAWTCLRRQAANAHLPEDTFANLPTKPDHAWVIVVDDADNIGPTILAAVKKVAARTDVHLLLAARDAEWQLKRLVPGMWQPFADFHTEPLAGLDQEDARRIVAGWAAWGGDAMGKLTALIHERLDFGVALAVA